MARLFWGLPCLGFVGISLRSCPSATRSPLLFGHRAQVLRRGGCFAGTAGAVCRARGAAGAVADGGRLQQGAGRAAAAAGAFLRRLHGPAGHHRPVRFGFGILEP